MDSSSVISIRQDPKLRKLNLGCGRDIRPPEMNWVNVDKANVPGVLELDIFALPWPLEADGFDYVLAKHVLEHVPHNIPEYGYEKNFLQSFMEEIWRVMKVGAILEVESPGGIASIVGAIDHKRIITPETFHVFYPGDRYDYYSTCRFDRAGVWRSEPLRFKVLRAFLKRAFGVDISSLSSRNVHFLLRKMPRQM